MRRILSKTMATILLLLLWKAEIYTVRAKLTNFTIKSEEFKLRKLGERSGKIFYNIKIHIKYYIILYSTEPDVEQFLRYVLLIACPRNDKTQSWFKNGCPA